MTAIPAMRVFLGGLLGLLCAGTTLAAPPQPAALPALPLPISPASAPAQQPPAASAPSAAPAPSDVMLYDGRALADAGLTVAPWGGGAVEESATVSLANGHALKVTTLSPYEGAALTFNTPVALDPGPDKDRVLLLTLRLTTVSRHFPLPPSAPASPAAPGGGTSPGDNGNGQSEAPGGGGNFRLAQDSSPARFRLAQGIPQPPGMPPGMMPPMPNGPPTPSVDNSNGQDFNGLATLKTVRLVFTLENGAQADVIRPFPDAAEGESDEEHWATLGVPLAALPFPTGTASPLKSVTIAGDDYAVFYIGQMKIGRDDVPITCFAGDQQTAASGDVVTLHGNGSGGFSSLKFSWDFDASDGVTEQATGQTVTTQFLKGGRDYKVTLTVSDIDGLKKPAVSTTVVHVE